MVNMGHTKVFDPIASLVGDPVRYQKALDRERRKALKRKNNIDGANGVNSRLVKTSKTDKGTRVRRYNKMKQELRNSMYAKHMPWLTEEM
ncbi:hypothetical protein [Eupransor demetentiae]|uniref:Uncharacterized protein n=1 Tax=Eupransor demetentiae TaxID=3109584 RepID=A0ABM9N4M5_9LACO|nr:hypothetical protein R54876_GBNLAHCA_00690 [Lactobacillaceae bacterium LMG 33000]